MSAPSISHHILNWFFFVYLPEQTWHMNFFWHISRHTKCVMDVLNIPYNNIEVDLIMYTTINMICKEIPGNLMPFQMARFLFEFKITNTNIWSNLTFNQAKQLLENLENNNDTNMKTNSIIFITNNISAMKASSSMSIATSKIKN